MKKCERRSLPKTKRPLAERKLKRFNETSRERNLEATKEDLEATLLLAILACLIESHVKRLFRAKKCQTCTCTTTNYFLSHKTCFKILGNQKSFALKLTNG